jgi:hypothetical protein
VILAFQVRFSFDTVKPILTLFPWTALKEYESRLIEYTHLIEQEISRANGRHINGFKIVFLYTVRDIYNYHETFDMPKFFYLDEEELKRRRGVTKPIL